MSREALDMRTTLFGRQHPEVAAVLTELGTIAADRGDYVSAEKLLDEALDIERSVSPVPQRETAKSLVARGRVFYDKGDFASAERNFRQAMEIYA